MNPLDAFHPLGASVPQALYRLRTHHPEGLKAVPTRLADAQLVVAREHGFESWTKLKAYAKPQTFYQAEEGFLLRGPPKNLPLEEWIYSTGCRRGYSILGGNFSC